MSDISLSKAVRSNLLSLQNTASMMAKTQERLATGNKVNSALDNPTNFFTASSLNSRAGDINQLLDGMANGIQTIKAADNGLTAITKTLESMQSTLRQARQDKSFQTESFTIDAADIDTSAIRNLTFSGGALEDTVNIALNTTTGTAVQSTATGATFVPPSAGDPPANVVGAAAPAALADGSSFTLQLNGVDILVENTTGADFNAAQTGAAIESAITAAVALPANATALAGISAEANATTGVVTIANSTPGGTTTITDNAGATAAGFANGASSVGGAGAESWTFSVNGTEITLNAANAGTAADAATTINTFLDGTGFTADGSTGALVISGAADGSNTVEITGAGAASVFGGSAPTIVEGDSNAAEVKTVTELVHSINNNDALKGKIRASNDNGKLRIENLSTQGLDIGGVGTNGKIDGESSLRSDVVGGNSVRSDLANQFRELRDQLDKLADDASFNGINLLRGDNLQITFNETSTSELNIRSKDEQGISSTVLKLETNLQASDLDSDANIDKLIAGVKTAINDVRSQSSAFGSSLSVVQNRQDFSKNMINTLQTGASNLTLADMNEEAANLLALQTRQSLSSSALSMASQADQSVLQLLR